MAFESVIDNEVYMTEQSIDSIREQLLSTRNSIATALASPEDGGVPEANGLYAWWLSAKCSLPGIRLADETPIYIGIAPKNAGSAATIRSRILKQHLKGAIGSSTFRFSLAALLWREQGWHPIFKGTRPILQELDLDELSTWQEEKLRLSWVATPEPWAIEASIIRSLVPPLNIEHNHGSPAVVTVNVARAELRAEARRN